MRRILADLRFVRSMSLTEWYGQIAAAWDSLDVEHGTEGQRWRNLGYWEAGWPQAEDPGGQRTSPGSSSGKPETLDEACGNLARKLADAAGVEQDHSVLDVGCGFGASTRLLHGERGPAHVAGLDLTEEHVRWAARQRRAPEDGSSRDAAARRDGAAGRDGVAGRSGVAGRQTSAVAARPADDARSGGPVYLAGDATRLPFRAGAFDRLLALECAFHFPSRSEFFASAHGVLRPGGVLAVADVVIDRRFAGLFRLQRRMLPGRLDEFAADILKMPVANLVSLHAYREQLETAGFTGVIAEDITEHVFAHFRRQWRRVGSPARQEAILAAKGATSGEARAQARAWRRQMSVLMLGWRMSRFVIVTARR